MIILDDAALTLLKNNIDENLPRYAKNKKPWIHEVIEDFSENEMIQDDCLILSPDPNNDRQNAIRLYEKFKAIPSTLASSNHYWTTLAHTNFYEYVHTRWIDGKDIKRSNIEERFFFSSTNQKSRARHALARLWWIAHLTYDETNKNDPYFYTKIATQNQDLHAQIMENKHVAQNKKALFAMLDVFLELFDKFEKEGRTIEKARTFYRRTMQQMNLIGSVTVWELLSRDEAQRKIATFVYDYLK